MSTPHIATSTDILVIGGGPSGSYAASALAREGYEVTLLERDHFPRYHIGESMLPSCRPFMRFIGVEQKVVDFGFCVKVGAALKFNQTKREGYTDFINPDPTKAAWNVSRAEFDDILLKHAGESGARVHEGVSVGAINFSSENDKQPVSAEWKSDTGLTGELKFKYLVDASGRNGLMSTKYLKNRKFNQALRSVAFWGYWTGAGMYAPGTSRENATWLEALTDESGWCWFIPLAKGKVSVGIVLKEESSRAKKAQLSGPDINTQHYHTQLKLVPGVTRLLGDAKFLGEVMSAGDYSYSASQYAGPNYRIVGDAGAFIDPFFSSGVHLAFSSGLSAASSIAAAIRGHCTEEEAISFHNEKTGTSYTRFLLVVMSAYRQITSQSVPVLSDIDEDNFDRAFDFIRPVIQGTADTNDPTVTEEMLQSTMDFCEHALGLTDPEMHENVKAKLEPGLIDTLMADDGPILGPKDVMRIAGDDEETEAVLRRINSRKALEAVHWQPNFRGESFGGFSINMERGSLGLQRAAVAS
ncbi:putative halogenase [Mycena alexandri]|uniref:Halogenase n=1 Tax=Mycena alexandri TaxID=1745969 RepID=A0AAD6SW66_9AGAR|nr:putative halogenase [Mycena alexandri]